MKKINILYTINYITNGGPSRVLLNTIKNLNREKYNITVLTIIDKNNKTIVDELRKNGIKIVEIKINKSLSGLISNYKLIEHTIIELHPDIIHTHGIVTSIIVASKKIKSAKITTIHNDVYNDYAYTYGKIKGKIIAFIHMNRIKKFNQIICCSKSSYEVLKNKFKNINYINNGADMIIPKDKDTIRGKIRKELNIPSDAIVYIYVGVINERKRVVDLVKKFVDCSQKNEYLLIVGDGPLLKEAENHKNDNVIFVGFKENVADYYLAADIYTSNSSTEGFSISIIEALECGLLLLLSKIPSHMDCFQITNKYYIGEYFDENNFATKKRKLYKHINIYTKNEIIKFKDKYLSSKKMTSDYCEYYNCMLRREK